MKVEMLKINTKDAVSMLYISSVGTNQHEYDTRASFWEY
jgi:hypothetical protein